MMNKDCDESCFSIIQSSKSLMSLSMGLLASASHTAILPENLIVVITIVSLSATVYAAIFANAASEYILAVLSPSCCNLFLTLLRSLFSRSWDRLSMDDQRAEQIGKLTSLFSLGGILGPLIGSQLLSSHQTACMLSSLLLVMAVVASLFLVKCSKDLQQSISFQKLEQAKKSRRECKESWHCFRWSADLMLLIFLKFCMGFAYGLFLPAWRQSLRDTFSSPQIHAYFVILMTISYALSLKCFVGKMMKISRSYEGYVLACCGVVLGGGRLIMIFCESLVIKCVQAIALSVALAIANTMLSVACVKLPNDSAKKSIHGLLDCTESIAGIISAVSSSAMLKLDPQYILFGVCLSYVCFIGSSLAFFSNYFFKERNCSITKRRSKSPTSIISIPNESISKFFRKKKRAVID